ncbi:single-stranded DNA-binding protein, partial [Gordonia sp. i37]
MTESDVKESGVAEPEVAESEETGAEDDGAEDDGDRLFEEGEIAGDYLEQLLDVLDFDGDIDLDVDGDRAVVSIDGGDDLAKLVGRKGEVLDALQELTRLAVQQVTGDRSRLMLDIARWRADRRDRLGG